MRKAALSPYSIDGAHASSPNLLSASTVDAIHRITTDPSYLSERWDKEVNAAGILPEELVEIISICGVITIADTLARAYSLPERLFPDPDEGQPAR